MNKPSRSYVGLRFLARHYVGLLTTAAVLFVLQTGLVPFDFTADSMERGSTVFFTTAVDHVTFPDIASNIFLYVPVGLLLYASLSRQIRGKISAMLITVAIAGVLSGGIEWLQAYSALRVSSLLDFIGNVFGAVLGGLISWFGSLLIPRLIGRAIWEFHHRPQAAIVKTYCLSLVIFAALPFSFSFDVGRFKQSVKSAVLVPFGTSQADQALKTPQLAQNNYHADSLLAWKQMKRWSRWAAECASFAVLAWLLQGLLRCDYLFGRRATIALVWWLGGAMAISLSIMQLPIISRACDVTDILFRLLGLWLGLVIRSAHQRDSKRLTLEAHEHRWRKLAKIGSVAVIGYILYTGLIPWRFDIQSSGLAASMRSERLLPFFAYFFARFDLMMDDVMEKFISYVVLAVLLALYWSRPNGTETKSRLAPIMAVSVVLATVIEVVQAYSPIRITSLTDIILAGSGCLVGVIGQRYLVHFYRFSLSGGVVGPEERRSTPSVERELLPSDALVASLMDSHPNAPVEPSPQPIPKPQRKP